ncbi:MAG: hypothetical protein WCQ97_10550 [Aminobacterium sp.]
MNIFKLIEHMSLEELEKFKQILLQASNTAGNKRQLKRLEKEIEQKKAGKSN